MDFSNFNGYITLINDDIPPDDVKYFEVNKEEFQMEISDEDFNFDNITDFFLETDCSILGYTQTHKGENLENQKLHGFITSIRIDLKEILEYNSETSGINMFFNEDCVGASLMTPTPLSDNMEAYFYLNFAYIYEERERVLNISLVYTVYVK